MPFFASPLQIRMVIIMMIDGSERRIQFYGCLLSSKIFHVAESVRSILGADEGESRSRNEALL